MSFKKKNYTVIKKAIDSNLAQFLYRYSLIKREVAKVMFHAGRMTIDETLFGVWTDKQVPQTYSHYADIAMETLLLSLQKKMEKATGMKLVPNYSYFRIYKKGDVLKRHTDRFSCEVSTTLNLGGDPWPIYLKDKKEIKVNLKPGDMLVYKGNLLEHWRNEFTGENCSQVFLHYTNEKTRGAKEKIYDERLYVGLPFDMRGAFKKSTVKDKKI